MKWLNNVPNATGENVMTEHRTDWMSGKVGLMVHWIAPGPWPQRGDRITDLNRAVDGFDVDRFMAQVDAVNAAWVIFTLGQNTGWYASPNATLDQLAGPGHASRRDLAGEIAARCKASGKRFIAYLPAEVRAQSAAMHHAFHWNIKDQSRFQETYRSFVRDYALKFGTLLDGWWFDGCYVGHPEFNVDYDWPAWIEAARAGNDLAVVAFNDGSFCIGRSTAPTELADYLSGEAESIAGGVIHLGREADAPHHLPEGRWVNGTSMQWHVLTYLDVEWMHGVPGPMPEPRYTDHELQMFVRRCTDVGGAVTVNVGIYQEGILAGATVDQLRRIGLNAAAV